MGKPKTDKNPNPKKASAIQKKGERKLTLAKKAEILASYKPGRQVTV